MLLLIFLINQIDDIVPKWELKYFLLRKTGCINKKLLKLNFWCCFSSNLFLAVKRTDDNILRNKTHAQFVYFILYYHENPSMSKKDLQKFGKKLKFLRIDKGLTQLELAEILNMSPNFIGMIERGERNTTVENVFKISRALKVKPSSLFED